MSFTSFCVGHLVSFLLLNSFQQSHTEMTGHYRLAKNVSWNQANFKTYLLFSIRQILHKVRWQQATKTLFTWWKENLIYPVILSIWYNFLLNSSIKVFKSYQCHKKLYNIFIIISTKSPKSACIQGKNIKAPL